MAARPSTNWRSKPVGTRVPSRWWPFLHPLIPQGYRLWRRRGRTPRSSRWRPREKRRPWPNSRRLRRRLFPRLVGGYEPQQHRWGRAGAEDHTGGGQQRACYDSKFLHRQPVYAKAEAAVRVAKSSHTTFVHWQRTEASNSSVSGPLNAWCELAKSLKSKGGFIDTQTESRLVQRITPLFSITAFQ